MQPKHLNEGISAKVLEAEFNDKVAREIVSEYAIKQGVLAQSMLNPNDLASLLSSMIMQVMEQSSQNRNFQVFTCLTCKESSETPLDVLSGVPSHTPSGFPSLQPSESPLGRLSNGP